MWRDTTQPVKFVETSTNITKGAMAKHSYGHGVYSKMAEIAQKYDIPMDMVAATILRSVLKEHYGFICNCPEDKIIVRRDGTRPHCKWCWNFVEIVQTRDGYIGPMGSYRETRPQKSKRIPNKFEEDLGRKLRRENIEEEPTKEQVQQEGAAGK
jgi:hypothetical protein